MTRSINEKFLAQLTNAPCPSGYEQPGQRLFREYVKDYVDSLSTDIMGNVIATLNPSGMPRILIGGHMDEIGLQIRYISEKGFLYFNPLGGVDAHLSAGNRVRILTSQGEVVGIVGKKAIHLQDPEERTKIFKLKDQFIDIGASSRTEVEQIGVKIGDPVIFDYYFEYMGAQGLVVSRCFDNKIGCFIVAEILREFHAIQQKDHSRAIIGVSTVQEEVGLRGISTSGYHIAPHVGIIFDVDFASDSPDVKEQDIGIVKLGGGPILSRGPNINPKLFELFATTAKDLGIPVQIIAEPEGTGTDANILQLTREGVATAIIGIPTRYIHSSSGIIHLDDVENSIRLTTVVIRRITDLKQFLL